MRVPLAAGAAVDAGPVSTFYRSEKASKQWDSASGTSGSAGCRVPPPQSQLPDEHFCQALSNQTYCARTCLQASIAHCGGECCRYLTTSPSSAPRCHLFCGNWQEVCSTHSGASTFPTLPGLATGWVPPPSRFYFALGSTRGPESSLIVAHARKDLLSGSFHPSSVR